MPVLYRASAGYLLRHPLQLALAILGISIGVAVMVSVDLANQGSRKAFYLSMDALNGEATHQVVGGPSGIDESLYADLRVLHGLQNIAPVVEGRMRIGGETFQLLGVDVFAERQFRSYAAPGNIRSDVVAGGSGEGGPETLVRALLVTPGALLMSAGTAARLGLARSQPFEVTVNGRREEGRLVGTLGGEDDPRLASIVVADIGSAQAWLGKRGRLSRIDVRISPGNESAIATLVRLLPDGVQLLPAATRTATTAGMSDAFMTNLTAMSLLAMLVGIFLIYNSVAFAVLQRRDLLAVLRALGVTRGQVFRQILLEAAVIGIIGATAGLLFGSWLGQYLVALVARTISDHYFAVTVAGIRLEAFTAVKGLLAGLLATLAAAMVPAAEAASQAPKLAMTRSTLERRAGSLAPRLAVCGLLLVALATAVLWVSGRSLVAGLVALFGLILGMALCIPLTTRVLAKLIAPLAGRSWGIAGRLAIASVGQTLSRTGVAIVALCIAVSATIGVSVMVDSFRASVSDWLESTLQSDIYIAAPGGTLDPELLAALAGIDGIDAYSTTRRTWLETEETRTRLIAIRMAPGSYAGTRIRGGDADEAWRRFDEEGAVLVSDAYAYRDDTGPGQSVRLPTDRGFREFDVAGVFQSYDPNSGAIVMSRQTYDRHFDDAAIDSVGIYLDAAADADAVMTSLRRLAGSSGELAISSNARIRELSLRIFDRTFVITNVLYWLAVFVAVIGILGAMMALQLERAREFGILRAVGMTPGETGILVSIQSAFMGAAAGLAAIPLGLVMAWVLIAVINRRAFGWEISMQVAASPIVWALCLAVGSAVLAGAYPALRAARTRPALAMREE
jgi:putative ABC transport system permease protein